jgi:hypothetical protein
MNPLNILTGYRTYIGAAALVLLAIVDFSNGDVNAAATKLSAALVAFGLRKAVDNGGPPAAP